jgi:hypothetical protein
LKVFVFAFSLHDKANKKPNKEELTDNGHYRNIQEDIKLVNCQHDIACPRTLFLYLLWNLERGKEEEEKRKMFANKNLVFPKFLVIAVAPANLTEH